MAELPLFYDRQDAGNQLAQAIVLELAALSVESARFVVYALPKGGLPVAEPIAQRLQCPLDVIVSKKITRPENPELAIGAVTADGYVIQSCQEPFTRRDRVWKAALQQAREEAEAQRSQFSAIHEPVDPQGAIAILVDDGIATGMTMAAAVHALRAQHPVKLLICTPVAPQPMLTVLEQWGDRAIVLAAPDSFPSVSHFYTQFQQVELEDAIACLERVNSK